MIVDTNRIADETENFMITIYTQYLFMCLLQKYVSIPHQMSTL